MNIYLLNYLNYSNRIIERHELLEDYLDYVVDVERNVNFKELDGVSTTQVVNAYADGANYVLVVNTADEIVSRWWVLEAVKQREHQYLLTLRRDVIADYMQNVLQADTYIRKGWIDDPDNPLLLTDEDISVSQVKVDEVQLPDTTNTPWIVAYCDPMTLFKSTDYLFNHLDLVVDATYFSANFSWNRGEGSGPWEHTLTGNETLRIDDFILTAGAKFQYWFPYDATRYSTEYYHDPKNIAEDMRLQNLYFYITESGNEFAWYVSTGLRMSINEYPIQGAISVNNWLGDAPYAMFASPLDHILYKADNPKFTDYRDCIGNRDIIRNAYAALQLKYQQAIYDVQILPYCPFTDSIDSGKLNFTDSHYRVLEVNTPDSRFPLVFATKSSFSIEIDNSYITTSDEVLEKKLNSATQMYRIVAQNHSGIYEFNGEKAGPITKYQVNCTYRPYNPFIQIKPVFSEYSLYQKGEFKDSLGSIMQGNTSLGGYGDAWRQYELNNATYKQAFDSKVRKLESERADAMTGMALGGLYSLIGNPNPITALNTLTSMGLADKRAADNIEYTKQVHEFQLSNIKAMPGALTGVPTLNTINKDFPFIEKYECTEVERDAIGDKLRLEGMTVNIIGHIADYVTQSAAYGSEKHFVSGDIITMNIQGDTHMYEEIKSEIMKGVRI